MHVAASVFSNSDRSFGDAMNKYLPVYKGQGFQHIITAYNIAHTVRDQKVTRQKVTHF